MVFSVLWQRTRKTKEKDREKREKEKMSIVWLCVGIVIGLFIPGPFNKLIKGWLKSLWTKIIGKLRKTQNSE